MVVRSEGSAHLKDHMARLACPRASRRDQAPALHASNVVHARCGCWAGFHCCPHPVLASGLLTMDDSHQIKLFEEDAGEIAPPEEGLYLGTSGWSYSDWE